MQINWQNIQNTSDWLRQFEGQIRTTPLAIPLGDVWGNSGQYLTHISAPTRKALESHGLGFMVENMAHWAGMDIIVLSELDTLSVDVQVQQVWDLFRSNMSQAQNYANANGQDWLAEEHNEYSVSTALSCEDSDPFSYAMQLDAQKNAGFIVLPHLEETLLLNNVNQGDYLRFNVSSALAYTRDMARDIAAITMHEIGHVRAKCAFERNGISDAIVESLESLDVNITHEDISSDLQNAMYLRHEVEADYYAFQMLSRFEQAGRIQVDPIHRSAYLGHRALDAIAGGQEHMTAIAIKSNGVRQRVNLLGAQESVADIHSEFGRREMLELDGDGILGVVQDENLYHAVCEIHQSRRFSDNPYAQVLLNQFITAARAFAPDHFGIEEGGRPEDIAAFEAALDYKL